MMDSTKRGYVTFGKVAWIQFESVSKIQKHQAVRKWQGKAMAGLGFDEKVQSRQKEFKDQQSRRSSILFLLLQLWIVASVREKWTSSQIFCLETCLSTEPFNI